MKNILYKRISLLTILALLVSLVGQVLLPAKVYAANFTESYLRLARVKAAQATGGTVCAKPVTVGTEAKVLVTFPTGFTVNSTAGNWTVTTTNLPTGSTAWVGIDTATDVTDQTVTFVSGELSVGTMYCFNFSGTNTLTNSSTGVDKRGTINTKTTGDVTIDSSDFSTAIITNDQIVVSAVVPPTFTLILGGNTATFTSDLSTGSVVSTNGVTAEMRTNASNGWYTWVKSANTNLSSAITGENIPTAGTVNGSPNTLSAGTSGYALDANLTTDSGTGDGTVTIDPEYNGTDTSSGGTLSSNFQPVASGNGTTDGDVITLVARAAISAVQAAASDYTDTLTVVSAGRF